MTRAGSVSLLLLGVVAMLLGLVVLVGVWMLRPRLEAQALGATSAVLEGADGMVRRLTRVDELLGEADDALELLRPDAEEAVRTTVREALASTLPEVREQLQALRDVARGIDALLAAVDGAPFLELGRVGGERAERLQGRLGDDVFEGVADLTPVRDLVADARTLVGDWRRSLDELRTDVAALQDDLPGLLWLVVAAMTALTLGCITGGVCLIRAGRSGPRPAA